MMRSGHLAELSKFHPNDLAWAEHLDGCVWCSRIYIPSVSVYTICVECEHLIAPTFSFPVESRSDICKICGSNYGKYYGKLLGFSRAEYKLKGAL